MASKWSLSFGCPHQNPVCTTHHPHLLHAPANSLFAIWSVEYVGQMHRSCRSLCKLLQSPLSLVPPPYEYLPQHRSPNAHSPRSLLKEWHQVSHSQPTGASTFPQTYRTMKYVVTSVKQGSVLWREGSVTNPCGATYLIFTGGEAGYQNERGPRRVNTETDRPTKAHQCFVTWRAECSQT